jgi:hypothetical protein
METFEMCDAAKAESNYFNFSEGMRQRMESKTFEKGTARLALLALKKEYNKLRNSAYQHQLFFIFKKPRQYHSF